MSVTPQCKVPATGRGTREADVLPASVLQEMCQQRLAVLLSLNVGSRSSAGQVRQTTPRGASEVAAYFSL